MNDLEHEISASLRRQAAAGPRFVGITRTPSATRVEVRRPRTWLGVVAIGGVVAAIAISGFVLGTLQGDDGPREPGSADVPSTAHTSLIDGPQVGRGRLVVSVPQSWSRGAAQCGVATEDTVLFASGDVTRGCFKRPSQFSTVTIDAAPSAAALEGFERKSVSSGQVYYDETGEGGFTVVSLASTDHDALITIRSRDAALAVDIAGSAQVLPEGMTTVPDLTTGATGGEPGVSDAPGPDEVLLRLQKAELRGDIVFEAGATAETWARVATDVPAGAVVEADSTVTVTYGAGTKR